MDSVYFSNKRAHANRNFNSFGGSVAQSFNNGSMFEEFDGFSGIASNDLRGFKNASGCDSYNASGMRSQGSTPQAAERGNGKYTCRDIYGGVYYSDKPCVNEYGVAAKQIGGTDCGGKCGQHWGITCPSGCRCSSTLNGVCESTDSGARQVNRKSRRASADRVSVNPVVGVGRETASGNTCSGKCGSYHGVGCDSLKGCRCSSTYNGVCESVYDRTSSTKATARQMNFSHHSNFVAPVRGFKPARSFSGGSSRCALDR